MHMRQQITPITTSPPTLVRSVRTDRTGSSGVVIQSSNWRVLASVYELDLETIESEVCVTTTHAVVAGRYTSILPSR